MYWSLFPNNVGGYGFRRYTSIFPLTDKSVAWAKHPGMPHTMSDSYLFIKTLHILGIIVFYGNVLISSWWKFMAVRNGRPEVIAFAQRQITLSDIWFTSAGSVVILLTGVGNAHLHGTLPIDTPWMVWGLWLFIASGIIWGLFMVPIQVKQARMAKDFESGGEIPALYWKLERQWLMAGAIAKLLPPVIIGVMVFKPV